MIFSNKEKGIGVISVMIFLLIAGVIGGGSYYYFQKEAPADSTIVKVLNEEQKDIPTEIPVNIPTEIPTEQIPPIQEPTVPVDQIIPQEVVPSAACQNECPTNGIKKCTGSSYQVCGNYDVDNCLEWGSVNKCPSTTICQSGNCILQKCSDGTLYEQCSPVTKSAYCQNGTLINKCSTCGCPTGKVCQDSGSCIEEVKQSVLIFADKTTYQQLKNEIDRLASDIEKDTKYDVDIKYSNYSSAVQIRNVMKDYYEDKYLAGSILIGDIPTFQQKDAYYYTDWFYKELSDRCSIKSNGEFEYDANNCKPVDMVTQADVFVGRITPPIDGSQGITLVKKYLDKNHDYRDGKIVFEHKMLIHPYISIIELGMTSRQLSANLDSVLTKMYGYSRNQVDLVASADPETAKQGYLQNLNNNSYEFALLNMHGGWTYQAISGATVIDWREIESSAPNAFFINLLTCNTGAFQNDNYYAGWLLFSGNTLVVTAAPIPVAAPGILPDAPVEPKFILELTPLEVGASVGEMFRHNTSDAIQLFGDPTLTIQRSPLPNNPRIITQTKLDFGKVSGGKSKSLALTVQNTGNTTLKLRYMSGQISINGKNPFSSHDTKVAPGVGFQGFTTGFTPLAGTISIVPNTKKDIWVSFAPSVYKDGGATKTGKYSGIFSFYTNDPSEPYFDLEVIGEGVN